LDSWFAVPRFTSLSYSKFVFFLLYFPKGLFLTFCLTPEHLPSPTIIDHGLRELFLKLFNALPLSVLGLLGIFTDAFFFLGCFSAFHFSPEASPPSFLTSAAFLISSLSSYREATHTPPPRGWWVPLQFTGTRHRLPTSVPLFCELLRQRFYTTILNLSSPPDLHPPCIPSLNKFNGS